MTQRSANDEIAHLDYAINCQEQQLACLRGKHAELLAVRDGAVADMRAQDEYLAEGQTKKLAEGQTKKLAKFFYAHRMRLVELQASNVSQELYPIAKQIWNCRTISLPFIKHLHRNAKQAFTYDVKNLSPSDLTDLLNLCKELAKKSWLEYQFNRKEDIIEVKPSISGPPKNFLNGGWAEETNRCLIVKALDAFSKTHTIKYKLFWDVKLKSFDSPAEKSHDMQLDLVVEINARFYIFETKSGCTLNISKWVDRARLFNHDQHRFITCCADENLNYKIFTPFYLFALPTLEKQFADMLNEDFPDDDATPAADAT